MTTLSIRCSKKKTASCWHTYIHTYTCYIMMTVSRRMLCLQSKKGTELNLLTWAKKTPVYPTSTCILSLRINIFIDLYASMRQQITLNLTDSQSVRSSWRGKNRKYASGGRQIHTKPCKICTKKKYFFRIEKYLFSATQWAIL